MSPNTCPNPQSPSWHNHTTTATVAGVVLLAVLVGASLLHISVGALKISWATVWDALFAFDVRQAKHHIIIKQRLPNVLTAIVCGATLGLAGFQAQKLFQNPLVSPSTLGVTSGASFFVVLYIYITNQPNTLLFTPAIVGALVAGACTLGLTRMLSGSTVSRGLHLVIAGSLVSIAFGAFTTFIVSMDALLFYPVRDWLMGSIAPANFKGIAISYPFFILGIVVLLAQSRPLDTLMMGDAQAIALGANVKRTQFLTVGGVFLLSALCVAVIGPIGFVGLVVPHMVKLFTNEVGYRGAILSMIIGALALVLADMVARTAIAPRMILVGAITAGVGGTFFLILLYLKFNRHPINGTGGA